MATIKLVINRLAFAPGEVIDLSKSTALFEGNKDDICVQNLLKGHYKLRTYHNITVFYDRSYNIGLMRLIPICTSTIWGDFQIPQVYPSFGGGVNV